MHARKEAQARALTAKRFRSAAHLMVLVLDSLAQKCSAQPAAAGATTTGTNNQATHHPSSSNSSPMPASTEEIATSLNTTDTAGALGGHTDGGGEVAGEGDFELAGPAVFQPAMIMGQSPHALLACSRSYTHPLLAPCSVQVAIQLFNILTNTGKGTNGWLSSKGLVPIPSGAQ